MRSTHALHKAEIRIIEEFGSPITSSEASGSAPVISSPITSSEARCSESLIDPPIASIEARSCNLFRNNLERSERFEIVIGPTITASEAKCSESVIG